MKHYKILSATNEDTLAEYVERAINDGWDLHGQMSIGNKMFYQPITRISANDARRRLNQGPNNSDTT